jgi:outer membrane protein OmpA-like peptidoglycan-associated protein
VNHLKNTEHYIDNPSPVAGYYLLQDRLDATDQKKKKKKETLDVYSSFPCKRPLCEMIQYDGFTKVLTAKIRLIPEKLYHFKIAIADVHDKIYDSGVILKSHTFKSYDKYGYIKGDTSGYRVKDEDLEKELKKEKEKEKVQIKEKPEKTIPSQKAERYTVFFDFDSSVFPDSSAGILKEIAGILKSDPSLRILLSGHTDSKGTDQYNQKLSERRNASVQKQLVAAGVEADRIKTESHGESKPKTENNSDWGRSRNRRVEIFILN